MKKFSKKLNEWWYWNKDNVYSGLIITPIALLLAFSLYLIFIWTPVKLYTENTCLKHGYPTAEVTVNLQKYCIKTIEQTQYVVPLGELKGK